MKRSNYKWDLTRKKIYDYLNNYIKSNWYSPTYKEISKEIWIQVSAIFIHIQKLCDLWIIDKDKRWCIYILDNYEISYKYIERNKKIKYEYNKWDTTLEKLWQKYNISWERIRQVILA